MPIRIFTDSRVVPLAAATYPPRSNGPSASLLVGIVVALAELAEGGREATVRQQWPLRDHQMRGQCKDRVLLPAQYTKTPQPCPASARASCALLAHTVERCEFRAAVVRLTMARSRRIEEWLARPTAATMYGCTLVCLRVDCNGRLRAEFNARVMYTHASGRRGPPPPRVHTL